MTIHTRHCKLTLIHINNSTSLLSQGRDLGCKIHHYLEIAIQSYGLISHLMCVYTAFLYSNLSAFPHILSLDECCIGVYQPLNLTPALYCGTQRQLMLKVCSRARDHLLPAIGAFVSCLRVAQQGGLLLPLGSCNACWEGGVRSGFLIRCDVYHLLSPH